MKLFSKDPIIDHMDRGTGISFLACLGEMMTVQTACGEIVARGQGWHVDFSEGVV